MHDFKYYGNLRNGTVLVIRCGSTEDRRDVSDSIYFTQAYSDVNLFLMLYPEYYKKIQLWQAHTGELHGDRFLLGTIILVWEPKIKDWNVLRG